MGAVGPIGVSGAFERAAAIHRRRWGEPGRAARAPGRVNLIGEHTDYNDGWTLPMALPVDTVVVASDDGDPVRGAVVIESEGFGTATIDPSTAARADGADPNSAWAIHVRGVVELLGSTGVPAGGWRAAIATDIPTGASLSSSAALEVALITMLLDRAGTSWSPVEIARLGQRVENEAVGLPSGIMDQLISAGAVAGHASLMDCRSLELTPKRMPASVVVAILDTGTRRVLADAAYADRRASCERAAAAMGVTSLRDANGNRLDAIGDETDRRRARHVLTENARTLVAADALERGDIARCGELMSASHASLRDDFEVSAPALDRIVDVARSAPGCVGARMTGGGFAGCAVALVEADRADAFTDVVSAGYRFEDRRARVWLATPAAGASTIPIR